jgi:hypothetical protein
MVHAKDDDGEEAGNLFSAAATGTVMSVLGNIKVTFTPFPKESDIKGRMKGKQKGDQVRAFVKSHVSKNIEHCDKTQKLFIVDGLTAAVFDEETQHTILNSSDHIYGISAQVMKGDPVDGEPFVGKLAIITHKSGATCTKSSSYFRNLLMNHAPEIFPRDKDGDFIEITRKKQSRSSKPSTDTSFKDIDEALKEASNLESGWIVVLWGKGGRACVGVKKWLGAGRARECCMGVSGAIYHRVASEADGWREISDWYGAKNRDELLTLRRTIPHNETNLSPTWSLKAGRMFHRQGAKAWTYIE